MRKKKYEVTEEGGRGPEEFICSEFHTLTVIVRKQLLLLLLLLFLSCSTAVIGSDLFSTWPPDVLVLR
jgi:hypothetical protein